MKNKKLLALLGIMALLFIAAGSFYKTLGNKVQPQGEIASSGKNKDQEASAQKPKSEKKKAPDFTIVDKDGKDTALSSQFGKPVVLNFWSSKCPPCRHEMPDFEEVYKKYKDKVNFMMVNSIGALGETKESGRSFIKDSPFTFPVFYDDEKIAQKTYGIYSLPTTYIIDKDGNLYKGQSGILTADALSKALDELLV